MLALRVEPLVTPLPFADFRQKLLHFAAAPSVQLIISWISPPFNLLPEIFTSANATGSPLVANNFLNQSALPSLLLPEDLSVEI